MKSTFDNGYWFGFGTVVLTQLLAPPVEYVIFRMVFAGTIYILAAYYAWKKSKEI